MEPWVINIDMEGFSVLWETEDQILWSLGELMLAIFRIGYRCYPDSPERIFAHQIGDGFVIVSDFGEKSLERAITIAVTIMQHVASSGRLTKGAIAEGKLSDIQSCYPKEVLNELKRDHTVSLKSGLMTIFPIMGTALIRSVKTAADSPRGPLLTIDCMKADRIPSIIPIRKIQSKTKKNKLISVDWVHMDTPLLHQIQKCSGLIAPGISKLEEILNRYCEEHKLHKEWISNVRELLGIKVR